MFQDVDPALANRCLLSAEHVFELANTSPTGKLLTVIPYSFYPETEWRDDLELGATELYFALASGGLPAGLPHTDPLFYLQKRGALGERLHDGTGRRGGHAEPVRRERARALRAVPRDHGGREPAGLEVDAGARCWPT